MRYANIIWAMKNRRHAHYEVAAHIRMEASHFSRCLNGRFEFASHERQRVAELLNYPAEWLFEEVKPPVMRSGVDAPATAAAMSCSGREG